MKAGYNVRNAAAVTLVAATAKTALMVITPAQFGGDLKSAKVGLLGVTSSEPPTVVELVRSDNSTNSTPGTGNTNESSNIAQQYGRVITAGFTAFGASTAEPTNLTVVDAWPLTPTGGLVLWDVPLDRSVDWGISAGLGIRLTAATGSTGLTARVSMTFERC